MEKTTSISIVLDKRRMKANGKYPVKLRVYTSEPKKAQKLYPTKFDYSESEFSSIWETSKTRKEFKDQKFELSVIEKKANDIAKEIEPFTFEQFERKMFRSKGDAISINYHYQIKIDELMKREQLNTASSYDLSRKSIAKYLEYKSKANIEALTFHNITVDWLDDYEIFMLDKQGCSPTTVGIYLRSLRAIFNNAIAEGEIDKKIYPFGMRKYKIPSSRNVKTALEKADLKALFNAKSITEQQQKAKDFWFFSYAANGMNIKDIALLKYKDITEDTLTFYRAKTIRTSRDQAEPIVVQLNDYTCDIITKYGNKNKHPENYVFDILTSGMKATERRKKIQNFTRFVNQHLKRLCKLNSLSDTISSYYARHSFASNSMQNGATIIDIKESLGHANITTTQNYLKSLNTLKKKELSNAIMNFD